MSLKASSSSAEPSSEVRSFGLVSAIAASSTPSSEPCFRSSSAAVFSPTPLAPGDAVGGVAAQGDEVGHQLGADSVLLLDRRGVNRLGALAAGSRVEHGDRLRRALEHVAVAGEQQRRAPGLGLEPGVGAEQVVGLERLVGGDLPAEGAEEVGGVCPLVNEVLGHLGPLGVIAVEQLDAVGRCLGAEAEHDRARLVNLDLAQDEVRRAEQGIDRLAVGALDRVGQGEERPVKERGCVDCEQGPGHGAHVRWS